MDVDDLKQFASDEKTFRFAALAMLKDIDSSLDRMKYLLELNVASNCLALYLKDEVGYSKIESELSYMRGQLFGE